MKKRKIILLVVLFLFVLGSAYLYFTLYLTPSNSFQPIYLVPKDAIYIIETDEPIDNWSKVSSSDAWKHLQGNAYFNELTASANSLDSLIKDNQTLFNLIGSRKIMASAHKFKRNDYDFLLIVDLQKASKLTMLKTYFNALVGDGYKVTRREYHGEEIIEMIDMETKETLYISFINNLFVCSYVHTLLENSIDQMAEPVIGRDLNFLEVNRRVADENMLRFYFQYSLLDDYMQCYSDEENEYVNNISEQLMFSGLSMDMEDDGNKLLMTGYTNINDTINSYLLAMLASGKGATQITSVAPQRTAFYFGMGFDSFLEFFENFEEVALAELDTYKEYQDNTYKVEKYLDIDIKEDFLSWVDDEIAFIQTQPSGLGDQNEFALVLKAKDGDDAAERLSYISKRIRKKTPVKFKQVSYEGYDINFLSVKGFFKLILGKFFADLEKPYFTIIDDFVVFSNHPQTLKNIIDDYKSGKTLDKADGFEEFRDSFAKQSNIFIYMQTPVLHQSLKGFVDEETWRDINKNKDYIVCFSDIGFQMTKAGDNLFETRLVTTYKPVNLLAQEAKEYRTYLKTLTENAMEMTVQVGDTLLPLVTAFEEIDPKQLDDDEVFTIEELNIDDLDARKHQEFHENGELKIEVSLKDGLKHGAYRQYYETGELKIKGRFKEDQKTGIWKEYDKDGNRIRRERF